MTDTASTRLAMCPFCGSEAAPPQYDDEFEAWRCGCSRCNGQIWADTEAEVIAAWNKRTPPSQDNGEALGDDVNITAPAPCTFGEMVEAAQEGLMLEAAGMVTPSGLAALSTAQTSEREQIVAWLRSDTAPGVALRTEYANAIERGDHLATPVEQSPVDVERVASLIALRIKALETPPRSARKDFAIEELRFVLCRLPALQSPPVEQPAPAETCPANVESDDIETSAWEWLAAHCHRNELGHFADRDWSPDDMVDAFMAGVSWEASRRKLTQAEAQQPSDGLVEHIAAILEEWDMKQPPDPFTGHDYRDIARDILTRAALSAAPDAGLVAMLRETRGTMAEQVRRCERWGKSHHEMDAVISAIDAHLSNTPGKEGSDERR